ncbi:MAG: alanyl-tRNA synthetase, partial [Geminicoccaceae bacterium]|nr:alanyl-tRNA synthetase [Geminicoccaceae bacterium]
MTERLYYTDSYLREFEAAVTDLADDSRRIYLDRTAFYPTSGGQPFDTGQIGGLQVTDVVDEGDRVAHLLADPLTGDRVVGRVDWTRRFDHMQQHTGQHLLSAVLADRLGYQTVAVHFGKKSSTLD